MSKRNNLQRSNQSIEMESSKKLNAETKVVKDILDERVMWSLSAVIGYEWALLAYNLGLTRADIAAFDKTCRGHKEKAYKMLLLWMDRHRLDNRRMRNLVAALELCGRKDLSQKIHCAQWADRQSLQSVELPQNFPMMIRINKVRPKTAPSFAFQTVNDLNPTSCEPVHSLSPRFIQIM